MFGLAKKFDWFSNAVFVMILSISRTEKMASKTHAFCASSSPYLKSIVSMHAVSNRALTSA